MNLQPTDGNAALIFDELAKVLPPRLEDNQKFLQALELRHLEEKSMLDLGCGAGGLLAAALKQGLRKGMGIDISEKLIGKAKQLMAELGVDQNVTLRPGDVMNLPSGELFDYITVIGVITYLKDPFQALDLWAAHLKEGGSVLVLFNRHYFMDWAADIFRFVLARLPLSLHRPLCLAASALIFPVQRFLSGREFDFKTVYEKVYNQIFSKYYHRFDPQELKQKLGRKFRVEELPVPYLEFTCPKTTFLLRLSPV